MPKLHGYPFIVFRMKRIVIAFSVLIAVLAALVLMPSILPDGQEVKPAPVLEVSPQNRPAGMVWIEGGLFTMGSDERYAAPDEKPAHLVKVEGFWMDAHEVTVAAFDSFVRATNYRTAAEQVRLASDLKKSWPKGLPFIDSIRQPGSFVAQLITGKVEWKWITGANWRQPLGPGSAADPQEPVRHISWNDAIAYCAWQGTRLPTEAEWEFAAIAGRNINDLPWVRASNSIADSLQAVLNSATPNGVKRVKQYLPNPWKLYDMAGNVQEWCADWYSANYYKTNYDVLALNNPLGPAEPSAGLQPERVVKGGDYTCAGPKYLAARPSARASLPPDFTASTTGFRTVMSAPMWDAKKALADK